MRKVEAQSGKSLRAGRAELISGFSTEETSFNRLLCLMTIKACMSKSHKEIVRKKTVA